MVASPGAAYLLFSVRFNKKSGCQSLCGFSSPLFSSYETLNSLTLFLSTGYNLKAEKQML